MTNLKQILARLVISSTKRPTVKVWTRRYGRLGVFYRDGVFEFRLTPEGAVIKFWSTFAGPKITREEAIAYYDEWYARQKK